MKIIYTFLFFLFALSARAQETFATLSFQLSFPQQEYKETFPRTGWGGRLGIMHRFADGPFSVGGEAGYLVTGRDRERFRVPFYGRDNHLEVTATNNIVTLAGKARADLLPQQKDLQIFIEGSVGTNVFFSKANYDYGNYYDYYYDYYGYYPDNNNSVSSKNRWTFIWGPGLGMELAVGKKKDVSIMAKASYIFGGDTRYLTDPYIDGNADVYFTERRSKTDMIMAEIGLRIPVD